MVSVTLGGNPGDVGTLDSAGPVDHAGTLAKLIFASPLWVSLMHAALNMPLWSTLTLNRSSEWGLSPLTYWVSLIRGKSISNHVIASDLRVKHERFGTH